MSWRQKDGELDSRKRHHLVSIEYQSGPLKLFTLARTFTWLALLYWPVSRRDHWIFEHAGRHYCAAGTQRSGAPSAYWVVDESSL